MLKPLFHLIVLTINSFVLWYEQTYIVLPIPVGMEGLPLKSSSVFLTFWCLILQIVYYFFALMNDILGTNAETPKKPSIIRQTKDTLFTLAFATAVYVSFAFWSIYAIDKNLIFPEYLEKMYHPSINHVIHTTVSLFIIIELISSYKSYPSRKTGISIVLVFNLCYLTYFFTIYAKTGAWVYPVFESLNWPLRILFVVLSLLLAVGFYLIGEKLNDFVSSKSKSHTNGIRNGISNGKKKH